MRTLKATTIILLVLLVICSQGFVPAGARTQQKRHLEVLEVKPEPICRGRNIVNAKIRNTSSEDQALSLDIRTEGLGGNWQTRFPHVIPSETTQWIRQAYKIDGFGTEGLRIRMRFYATGPATGANIAQTTEHFKTVQYSVGDLEHATPDNSESEPATESQSATITQTLRQFQKLVENEDYETAWQFFSQDFRDAELQGQLSTLRNCMERPYLGFTLSRAEVLALEPKAAGRRKDILALTTALEDERWMVNFVKVADKWRIDSLERIDATPKEEIPLEPEAPEQALLRTFEQWQDSIRDRKDELAWKLMASAWRRGGWVAHTRLTNDRPSFTRTIDSNEGIMRTIYGNLLLGSVTQMQVAGSAFLDAKYAGAPWRIHFAMEDGRWKIRHVSLGREGNRGARILSQMQKRASEHYDIFYYKGSTAEKEIDQIAERRDRGFRETCRFLGKDSDVRIHMVFFEDGASKYSNTGHTGAGMASGNTIVEIYNEKQKLDPYHETAHILMRAYGSPPALFNEGFATYISERLGSHALNAMSGGESSVYERVRELNGKGELIELEELLTYTEIGSGASNPPVAYPEAASFVKFLIDAYGKDKFLKAYRTLRNSSGQSEQQQNVETLAGIYGKSLDELKNEWKKAFLRLE